MIKLRALFLMFLGASVFPASACQEILANHPAIIKNADLVFEAVVASSEPDHGRTPNPMDPARILHLNVTKIIKGKVGRSTSIPTTGCYVPGYDKGSQVTVVRFPGGEYRVVSRPQR